MRAQNTPEYKRLPNEDQAASVKTRRRRLKSSCLQERAKPFLSVVLALALTTGRSSCDHSVLAFSSVSTTIRPAPHSFRASPSPTGRSKHVIATTSSAPSTSLQAVPFSIGPILATAAITSNLSPTVTTLLATLSAFAATITGGLVSGSLHAIAGPDHLAALIPRCCGLRWYRAARIGAVWGMGHGLSATFLGLAGFAFKKGVLNGTGLTSTWGSSLLHGASSLMELAIGISLVVIGLLGVKEAREWETPRDIQCNAIDDDDAADQVSLPTPQSLSSAATPPSAITSSSSSTPNPAKRAVLFNGILHGFSWDGAPSLAPAIAISTWRGSFTFLVSYALGTMAAMTLATTLIGEGTRRASMKLERPDLPRDLSVISSLLALAVGVIWCGLALR